MIGALNGHLEVTSALLAKEADVNQTNNSEWSALMCASSNGHSAVASELLAKGANVNHTDKHNGFSALIWAAYKGHPEVVKQLLNSGANKDVKSKRGETALDCARSKNHPAVVALLQ